MEHNFVKHVEIGKSFEDIYYLESISVKETKDGKKYSDLTLRDSSGSSNARYWGELEDVETGKFLACKVDIKSYNDLPQIIIQSCGNIDNPDDLSPYISISPTLEKDKETFYKVLKLIDDLCEKSQNKICSSIVKSIFNEKFNDKFFSAPYGTLSTYGKKGGLLAHAIKISTLANDISRNYQLNMLERAILISASLLQTVGGIDAYEIFNLVPRETNAGILMGKLNLSINILDNAVPQTIIDEESKSVYLRLKHSISVCSFTGQKPVTKEAVVLFETFKADFNITEVIDFIKQDTNKGDFTAFDSLGKRRYFKN